MSQLSITIGRILLGLYFFMPGLMKASQPAQTIAYMESHAIPFAAPLMWVSAIANLAGGVLLITGRHVKLVAYGQDANFLGNEIICDETWLMAVLSTSCWSISCFTISGRWKAPSLSVRHRISSKISAFWQVFWCWLACRLPAPFQPAVGGKATRRRQTAKQRKQQDFKRNVTDATLTRA